MKEDYGTLQEIMEGIDYQYNVVSFREFPESPLARASYMLYENFESYPAARSTGKYFCGYLYICDLLTIDLIMKKDNCISKQFLPQIKKALKAVLDHSDEIPLESDEWTVMTDVAKRVQENLPKLKIVPKWRERKFLSYYNKA